MNRSPPHIFDLPDADAQQGAFRSANPRIGVIYNPRSHRNRGQDLALGGRDNVMVATPQKRDQIPGALADFAARGIEYLIINGGDGTVRDVLTCGVPVFGDAWPAIAVLPKGKTNALNVDIGAPTDWTLRDAIDAYATGGRVQRRPLDITNRDSDAEVTRLRGFILGAGSFTIGVGAGQDAHSIGFFDSLAVGMTSAWGAVQTVFGRDSNPWRRGVEMTIRLLPEGRVMAHAGRGDPARRNIMLASTLERMPLDMKVFGARRPGLKIAVLDRPGRRFMACLPLILAGWSPDWLERHGLHRRDCEAFEFTVGDQFILDGETFPPGRYLVAQGPALTFVTA